MRTYNYFFLHDTVTFELHTLSLHDALPIYRRLERHALVERPRHVRVRHVPHRRRVDADGVQVGLHVAGAEVDHPVPVHRPGRSEEHTSELQSLAYLVCRLLLEKKKARESSP